MNRGQLLAYAQLLRLPNVFTAFADILMAAAVAGYLMQRPGTVILSALASGALYLSGMVWNDIFDREEDARVRSFRPLPSGRVTLRLASGLAIGLMVGGVLFGFAAELTVERTAVDWLSSGRVAVVLAAAILLYDWIAKRTSLGPLSMGLCRALNVLLGLSLAEPEAVPDWLWLHLPATTGLYIVGVTWFARTEEGASPRSQLLAGAVVMLSAIALAALLPLHRPPDRVSGFFCTYWQRSAFSSACRSWRPFVPAPHAVFRLQ